MKQVILVLGAQGNLGTCIVDELKKINKWEVIPWGRNNCDLLDEQALVENILRLSPNVIINTVAYNNVDECERSIFEQESAISLNVVLVDRLAKLAFRIGAKFIHFSTNYVFEGNRQYYSEYDSPHPVNFYGLTKYMGEKCVEDAIQMGLDACILRLSNLFGLPGTGNSCKPYFFQVMERVAKNKEYIQCISDEVSCFTYTRDVAERLVLMMDRSDFSGVYHFVNSTPLSWYEAIRRYFSLTGNPIEVKPISRNDFVRKAPRPQTAVLISTRMEPMRSFDEALKAYMEELN